MLVVIVADAMGLMDLASAVDAGSANMERRLVTSGDCGVSGRSRQRRQVAIAGSDGSRQRQVVVLAATPMMEWTTKTF